MDSKEIRDKFIKYFTDSPRNHKEIDPAPLVLENDPSTLFTSAGMQPLVPYLLGEVHPKGKKLVNSQPSIRLGDIEEVGDNRHITFFEMLGNWSLGDYFKDEQLPWIYEFITNELGIEKGRLWVSVFEGTKDVPKDEESYGIWKNLGLPDDKIIFYGAKKNWWSMTGTPEEMNVGHIGGPDSEMFYDFGEELHLHENSLYKNEMCHPNCDCGRFLEIGNSVFIQYKKVGEGKLEELPQKNVDFGGGLERITAVLNGDPDMFRTDLFSHNIKMLEEKYGRKYGDSEMFDRSFRIVADHLRASSALISGGVYPGNKAHGYILRRLIRRAVLHAKILSPKGEYLGLPIPDLSENKIPVPVKSVSEIENVINEESGKFAKAIDRGMKKLETIIDKGTVLTGNIAFDLYQTEGFPLELTLEAAERKGVKFSLEDKKQFQEEFEKHKNLSRTTSAGVFKGGLADDSPEVIKFHTATHLLLASLRKVLGDHVIQKGQNITKERSRFDFPNNEKLTDEQVKEVEETVNKVIAENVPVKFEVLPKDEALKTGAIHGFNEKYADTVKVYYVGENLDDAISREFCGGPHVGSTGEIGRVKINKQEKIGSGLVRVYMTLEK